MRPEWSGLNIVHANDQLSERRMSQVLTQVYFDFPLGMAHAQNFTKS